MDDPTLKEKVSRYVGHILSHQEPDGWLGPREMVILGGQEPSPHYDLWAQFLMLKVLVGYHDATGDPRVTGVVERALRCIDLHIDRAPLFNWGQFRWFEVLIAIYWLYEQSAARWLLDLAVKLQAQGFNWAAFLARWPLTQPTPKGRWNFMGHVVNNAMAIKSGALWWRLSQELGDRAAGDDMIEKLDQFHGSVTGVFTGDECLAGRRPTQGTELCAVVEYAYSLEILLSILGDPGLGDRLEKIIFNALPATFSPDMWSHQYDQQVNQVLCSVAKGRPWNSNGPEANIFGLEPNYGCCTANLSQGWPKFAAHLWMRTRDQGLAAVAYAPNRVSLEIHNVPVTATLATDYPFRDSLQLEIKTADKVSFPLLLRIPAWAQGAAIQIDDDQPIPPQRGTFHRIEREWRGSTQIRLSFPMHPTLGHRFNQAIAIERGPLVYALKMGEDWRRVHQDRPGRELPHADWEVYPTTAWNFALDVGEATLAEDLNFAEHPVGDRPFSPEGAPVTITLRGSQLPEWQMENGSCADVPPSPVASAEPLETLTLIPYGCTNLRVTEFPVLLRPGADR